MLKDCCRVRFILVNLIRNIAHAPSVQLQPIVSSFFDNDLLPQDELQPDICQDNVVMSSER